MKYYQRCLTIDDATREEVGEDLASIKSGFGTICLDPHVTDVC